MITSDSSMLNFIFIKGFGDFIIGANFLKALRREDCENIRILTTPRIAMLVKEIELHINFSILNLPGPDAPALFEIKRKGPIQAIQSGFEIKKAIHDLNSQNPISGTLIFDKLSFRERYISAGHKIKALPKNYNNIYQAYECLMRQLNFEIPPELGSSKSLNNTNSEFIGVFPISRAEEKDIPPSVLKQLNEFFQREGKKLKIYVFPDQLERYKGVDNIEVLSKDFKTLINIIRAHKRIISADSLPAHLSQYFNIPVFVLTPKSNHYWLPIDSFNNGRYCIFSDISTQQNQATDKLINFFDGRLNQSE